MSQNQENQINELNTITKATLGRSEVHGIGVIALRDIPERIKEIVELTKERLQKNIFQALPKFCERITVCVMSLHAFPL